MEYTTQMDAARKGIITKEMECVAAKEHMDINELVKLVACGIVINWERSERMQRHIINRKRFVRYKEGAEMYSMCQSKFEKMAKEANAVYKLDKLVLVNCDIFEAYLETFRTGI